MTLPPLQTPKAPRPHSDCWRDKNCGAADCPPAQAERRRAEARAGAWSPLTPPGPGGEMASYYHLDGRHISCNSVLELQQLETADDDYGEYPIYVQRGVRVRFELDGGQPVLYIAIGGHSAVIRWQAWMPFRWPARTGSA